MATVLIKFNQVNANALRDNSVVFHGLNRVFGWNSHVKQTHTINAAGIYNPHFANVNLLVDNDFFDNNIYDADASVGFK